MKKKLGLLLIGGLLCFGNLLTPVSAQQRINRNNSPEEVAKTLIDKANDDMKIQDTKFDKISNKGGYGKNHQITNTLDRIRKNIQPYLQWMLYIGLAGATILLIWNGFRLVTDSAVSGGDIKKVKENIQSILKGVIIMTSFLVIIKLVMALMNMFFSQ
ncbi:MAG: hypothetical protein DLD55_04645 [candidate division SR1 bacterium]|nr:MAG: hypothetical protein DLD55_04645 [candidate division SR1 bacterium]